MWTRAQQAMASGLGTRCAMAWTAARVSHSWEGSWCGQEPAVGGKMEQEVTTTMSTTAAAAGPLDYYEIESTLGSGTFATVYRAKDRGTGEAVALKKVSVDDGCVQREVGALGRIRSRGGHPNVAGLRGHWEALSTRRKRVHWVATELVDGLELFDYLVASGAFSERTAAECFRGVFAAAAKMHAWGVIHADIKPENLVLTGDLATVKLVDFGSALLDGAGPPTSAAWRYGTAFYSPPEVLEAKLNQDTAAANKAFASPAVDAWALGVTLYIALLGVHPFDPENRVEDLDEFARVVLDAYPQKIGGQGPKKKQHHQVGTKKICEPLERAKQDLSPAALDLLARLLDRDPASRASVEACLAHPWFHGAAGTTEALDRLATNLATWRRFKQRLEATALDALVSRARRARPPPSSPSWHENDDDDESSNSTTTDSAPRLGFGSPRPEDADLDDALAGLLSRVAFPTADEASRANPALVKELLSSLRPATLAAGTLVFEAGDPCGDDESEMYFVRRGRVSVLVDGEKIASLGPGDFFGEGAVVFEGDPATRSATVRVDDTGADLIAVARRDVKRLVLDAPEASRTLETVALDRALENAKTALKTASLAKRRFFRPGDAACRQFEPGHSVFTVEQGHFAVQRLGPDRRSRPVALLKPGDLFGETAVLDKLPRNATVVCASPDGCVAHEIHMSAFLQLLKRDPRAHAALSGLVKKRRPTHNLLAPPSGGPSSRGGGGGG